MKYSPYDCVTIHYYTFSTDGDDFIAINDTITFGAEEMEMETLIFIVDNSALEEVEQFTVKTEAVSGDFPVAVMNNTATVTITDNDGKWDLV